MATNEKNDVVYIFTPYITRPDGTRIYAKQYGKKAFRIPVSAVKESN